MPFEPSRGGRFRLLVSAVAATAAFTGMSVVTPPAFAKNVTGVRLVSVAHTGFKVRLDNFGTGWKYRLYASTAKSGVYYSNLSKAPYKSALVAKPQLALANLRYTTGVYWWRVQAVKGSYSHTSNMYSVGLVPDVPTGLTATNPANRGLSLTWNSSAATGYQIQQATDPAFTQNLVSYVPTRGGGHQFTPYGLTPGTAYYYRIRAVNSGTYSPWSAANPPVTGTAQANELAVRVASFNLLTLDNDGTQSGSADRVAKWQGDRDVAAADYIRAVMPDVIGIQEGASFVGAKCAYRQTGTRQVDDLVSTLQTHGLPQYELGQTEVRPCQPNWMRTGVYIVYDSSKWTIPDDSCTTMACKNFDLGTITAANGSTVSRYAAWEILQNRATGARFLFVSPHTYVGTGSEAEQLRQQETDSMIQQARALAHDNGDIPVVYAGDFNSNELHHPDGPEVATRNVGIADGLLVAPTVVNSKYNSANGYLRTPPAQGHSIDHVFAEPGVGVRTWGLYLRLSNGRFAGTIPADHNLLYADLTLPY
jgi:endonuclease/exonuclease/phosphatase family metal-dependent hydrolase